MGPFRRQKKQVWFPAELTYDDPVEVLARLRRDGVDEGNLKFLLEENGATDLEEILAPLGDLRAIPGRGLLDRSGDEPMGGFFADSAPALPGIDPHTGDLFLYPNAVIAECGGPDRRKEEQVTWRVRALEPLDEDVIADLVSDGWVVETASESAPAHG